MKDRSIIIGFAIIFTMALTSNTYALDIFYGPDVYGENEFNIENTGGGSGTYLDVGNCSWANATGADCGGFMRYNGTDFLLTFDNFILAPFDYGRAKVGNESNPIGEGHFIDMNVSGEFISISRLSLTVRSTSDSHLDLSPFNDGMYTTVSFDYINNTESSGILYNSGNGNFTILSPGIYELSFISYLGASLAGTYNLTIYHNGQNVHNAPHAVRTGAAGGNTIPSPVEANIFRTVLANDVFTFNATALAGETTETYTGTTINIKRIA